MKKAWLFVQRHVGQQLLKQVYVVVLKADCEGCPLARVMLA
jgi:hypothetical protein